MNKFLLALSTLLGCAMAGFAQNNYVATLQHEGEFTHYYGSGALTSAYNAAVERDIITLSPGTFLSPGTINKGITLRGTGIDTDATTTISGTITFYSMDSTSTTTIEGIIFNSTLNINKSDSEKGQGEIKVIKNRMSSVVINSSTAIVKAPHIRFYNDIIHNLYLDNYNLDCLLYNCYIEDPHCSSNSSESTTTFTNCIIRWKGNGRRVDATFSGISIYTDYAEQTNYLNFCNCIFNTTNNNSNQRYYSLPNTVTSFNCLSVGRKANLFSNILLGADNISTDSIEGIFLSYRDDYIPKETFELTDIALSTYLGIDNIEIGMQGGQYPFNTKVQFPVITSFGSEPKTSKEGLLNIELEVDER